ncbi:MAG: LLM class flavin-dependent oxidoreductase [Actinomycetota bacterium]
MSSRSLRSGLWLFPDRPAAELVEAIVYAEELGLDEIWLGDEGPAREPFTVLGAAAVRTERIRLGIGVTNPYVRHPGIAIATAATIAELAGPRVLLGVGAGGTLSLGPFELEAPRPLAAVRDFLSIARASRDGTAVPGYVPSELSVTAAAPPVSLYVGARGPRLNTLASEVADGAFVAGMPPFRFGEVIGWTRSVNPIDVALYPSAALDDASKERNRPEMVWALLDSPPELYDRFDLRRSDVEAAAEAIRAGDRGPAADLIHDDLLAELLLIGEPDVVGGRLADLVRAHRPASIGLAVITDDLPATIEAAAQTFTSMRKALTRRP